VLESAPDNPELTSVVEYLVRSCIDQIFDENDVYLASDTPEEEMAEFVDNLDIETFTKIREFFDSLPSLYYKIEYTNALGNKREIELTTLSDFFTWG
jgi:AAA+ ATPase superfamily predicted ATPase